MCAVQGQMGGRGVGAAYMPPVAANPAMRYNGQTARRGGVCPARDPTAT